MSESPKRVVTLSASNHFFLALKTFGYTLLGYVLIALIVLLIIFVVNL